jgi:hypothetical protein
MSWRDKIAAVLAGKVGGPTPSGIHVYHSSPHDFDKFDLSKLRTGEGANVYGAGTYLAENPAVSGQGGQYWMQFLNRFKGDEGLAADMLRYRGFDREQAAAALRKNIAEHQAELDAKAFIYPMSDKPPTPMTDDILLGHRMNMEKRQRALDLLESGQPVGPRTYEVNFRAKPEELLDWDKPLSKQPHVEDFFHDRLLDVMPRKAVRDELDVRQNFTGEKLYRDLTRSMFDRYGHRDAATNARYASETLAEGGIPGIRYLDEGSRDLVHRPKFQYELDRALAAKAQGDKIIDSTNIDDYIKLYQTSLARMPQQATHNYVAFDPSRLDIMAKYGVVGGVPLGAGAMGGTIDQSTYGERQ